ncbi:hypothetical protein BTI_143 [Burkholderia thailandensis MSMB121]|nr:hypothetical protein BTI_143 [Burkholderia thailandensis MSMB121]
MGATAAFGRAVARAFAARRGVRGAGMTRRHFQSAQRVSCFVVNACSPGIVATTL